jgi:hypothetical protein
MNFLRFPNPGSDIHKFAETFRELYKSLSDQPVVDLDDLVKAGIEKRLASSCGATGEEALERSTRADRSRDPLYNQLKMYSELWRMLGWLHTTDHRLEFRFSDLAEYVMDKDYIPLLKECLVAICFPNPHVANLGVKNSRPIKRILEIASGASGQIHRDEIILYVLTMTDDTKGGCVKNSVQNILKLRAKGKRALDQKLAEVSSSIQLNTLKNYTRFPLGVLKNMSWAKPQKINGTYGRSANFYVLTDEGQLVAKEQKNRIDVRSYLIAENSETERAHWNRLSHYAMLERCGYPIDEEIEKEIEISTKKANAIIDKFGITNRGQILYSPYQESPKADLLRCEQL